MKRFGRIVVISLLITTAGAMLIWYFFFGREIPAHARCIPTNAMAIITLNTKQLARDHFSNKHLSPSEIEKMLPPEIRMLMDEAEKTGTGINCTADVLAFMYQSGDAAFIGVSLSLKDADKFSGYIDQLSKHYVLHEMKYEQPLRLFQVDTSSLIFGWTNDLALLLYPFGNSDAQTTASQCATLLRQDQTQSVLTNENFTKHALKDFDAAAWFQPAKMISFLESSRLFRGILYDSDFIDFTVDFQPGEILARRTITWEKKSDPPAEMPLLLPCNPEDITGFWQPVLREADKKEKYRFGKSSPVLELPFSADEIEQLQSLMNNNSTVLLHDTISYPVAYIQSYTYDDKLTPLATEATRIETENGRSWCFGLKDEFRARELIAGWMKADSIPEINGAWEIKQNGKIMRLIVADKMLTWTSWHGTDGYAHAFPHEWKKLDLLLYPGNYLENFFGKQEYVTGIFKGLPELVSHNFSEATMMAGVSLNNSSVADIRVTLKNRK
ncbi:MAG TPA: DUF4836 family protein [Bacteroidia bacterium]|nr:DUF4836 family protein [Bacteroidia bacterium]